MNIEQVKNEWPRIKQNIKRRWSKLSEEEVNEAQSDWNSFEEIVEKKYGKNPRFEQECESLFNMNTNMSAAEPKEPVKTPAPEKLPPQPSKLPEEKPYRSAPDEFTPPQDPSEIREDVNLGSQTSAQTNSTATNFNTSSKAGNVSEL